MTLRLIFFAVFLLSLPPAADALDTAGHQAVAQIAAQLLDAPTSQKLKAILGDETLEVAAVWATCLNNIKDGTAVYTPDPAHPECQPFETYAGQQEMIAFVAHNSSCKPKRFQDSCHKQYHYAAVAIQRDAYLPGEVGTSDHDIVAAIRATVLVLEGGSSAAPFSFPSDREPANRIALRLLAHYVADIHDPLNVGAVYLDNSGRIVDPDMSTFDPATRTNGGFALIDGCKPLHAEWDDTSFLDPELLDQAKLKAQMVRPTVGPPLEWPVIWATESLQISQQALGGLSFDAQSPLGRRWPIQVPVLYGDRRQATQFEQLVSASARLAQLLAVVLP